MTTLKKNWAHLLILLCTLLVSPYCVGPENHLYIAYSQALIERGDLNLAPACATHATPERPLFVSRTVNLPDFHNHGGVVVWSPVLLAAKATFIVTRSWPEMPQPIIIDNVFLISSVTLCTFVALLASHKIAATLTGDPIAATFATIAVFVSSPLLFYSVMQNSLGNMTALMFGSLLLLDVIYSKNDNKLFWFRLGLFLALCFAVKVDLWFYSVLIGLFVIERWRARALSPSQFALLVLGFFLVMGAKLINDYLRLGTLGSSESSVINVRSFFMLEQLFHPFRGYFFYSPILLLALAGGVACLLVPRRPAQLEATPSGLSCTFLLWSLLAVLVLKIFMISFRFSWYGGTFGGRILITEAPIFIALLALLYAQAGKRARICIVSLAALCFLWNLGSIAEFYTNTEYYYGRPPAVTLADWTHLALGKLTGIARLDFQWARLFDIKMIFIKIVLAAGFIAFYNHRDNLLAPKAIARVGLVFVGLYALVTLVNLTFNASNARNLEPAVAQGIMVIVPPSDFGRDENIGSLDDQLDKAWRAGDVQKKEKLLLIRERVISEASPQWRKGRQSKLQPPADGDPLILAPGQ